MQPRGEPTTLSPDPPAFCLANVAAQGLSRCRCCGQAGQPLLASPGVTGDGSELTGSPDRVLRVAPSVQAPSREGWGVGGVFSIHSRNVRFETGKLFLGVQGRGIDYSDGFTGLAGLATLFCFFGTAFRCEYCQRSRGAEAARAAPIRPGGDDLGVQRNHP